MPAHVAWLAASKAMTFHTAVGLQDEVIKSLTQCYCSISSYIKLALFVWSPLLSAEPANPVPRLLDTFYPAGVLFASHCRHLSKCISCRM